MINSIRKFSNTPYAKVLLAIIILPFIMWGMGDVFRGGSKNTIVEIDDEKLSVQNFLNFINKNLDETKLNDKLFDSVLSTYIANNLVNVEAEKLNIKITDSSLAKLIKNNKMFIKNDVFSRTEYEKFLITNNMSAGQFEQNLREIEIKRQLFDFISGGVKSPKFLIKNSYDSNNQIRTILSINLKKIYKEELNFTDKEIRDYYDKKKENFSQIFRTIKFSNITPDLIIGENEYNNSFFQKLDEIDDAIASDIEIESVAKKFNLTINISQPFNKNGKNINGENIDKFEIDLIKKIFQLETLNKPLLINHKDEYFLIELKKKEKIFKKINEKEVNKKILNALRQEKILSINSEILEKIITNKFTKIDFDNLASNNNIKIEQVELKNINDNRKFNKNFVKNIYKLPEKKMYIFSDSYMKKNFLIYIENIKHVELDKKSDQYEKYLIKSNNEIIQSLYKTFDTYISNKYKVNINYKAVERAKNYLR